MIWYFVEGFYNRKNESNFKSNDFLKYVVSMPVEPETLTFYKSKVTEKWWMEISFHRPGARYARNNIIPCSYADYQTATKGEVPERWTWIPSKGGCVSFAWTELCARTKVMPSMREKQDDAKRITIWTVGEAIGKGPRFSLTTKQFLPLIADHTLA